MNVVPRRGVGRRNEGEKEKGPSGSPSMNHTGTGRKFPLRRTGGRSVRSIGPIFHGRYGSLLQSPSAILKTTYSEACLYAEFCLHLVVEAVISLGARSPAPSSSLPGAVIFSREGRIGSGQLHDDTLFGLAPRGVCTAIPVARDAVSSYLAISPLPRPGPHLVLQLRAGTGRYPFCCTFRRLSRPFPARDWAPSR